MFHFKFAVTGLFILLTLVLTNQKQLKFVVKGKITGTSSESFKIKTYDIPQPKTKGKRYIVMKITLTPTYFKKYRYCTRIRLMFRAACRSNQILLFKSAGPKSMTNVGFKLQDTFKNTKTGNQYLQLYMPDGDNRVGFLYEMNIYSVPVLWARREQPKILFLVKQEPAVINGGKLILKGANSADCNVIAIPILRPKRSSYSLHIRSFLGKNIIKNLRQIHSCYWYINKKSDKITDTDKFASKKSDRRFPGLIYRMDLARKHAYVVQSHIVFPDVTRLVGNSVGVTFRLYLKSSPFKKQEFDVTLPIQWTTPPRPTRPPTRPTRRPVIRTRPPTRRTPRPTRPPPRPVIRTRPPTRRTPKPTRPPPRPVIQTRPPTRRTPRPTRPPPRPVIRTRPPTRRTPKPTRPPPRPVIRTRPPTRRTPRPTRPPPKPVVQTKPPTKPTRPSPRGTKPTSRPVVQTRPSPGKVAPNPKPGSKPQPAVTKGPTGVSGVSKAANLTIDERKKLIKEKMGQLGDKVSVVATRMKNLKELTPEKVNDSMMAIAGGVGALFVLLMICGICCCKSKPKVKEIKDEEKSEKSKTTEDEKPEEKQITDDKKSEDKKKSEEKKSLTDDKRRGKSSPERSTQEKSSRERSTRERSSRERSTRERSSRDRSTRDRSSRERYSRERSSRQRSSRERRKKEDIKRKRKETPKKKKKDDSDDDDDDEEEEEEEDSDDDDD